MKKSIDLMVEERVDEISITLNDDLRYLRCNKKDTELRKELIKTFTIEQKNILMEKEENWTLMEAIGEELMYKKGFSDGVIFKENTGQILDI